MFFQHLYAKKVKLTDLPSMQRQLNRHANTNHALEELTPMQLNHRVKERIAQLHLKRRPRSDAIGIVARFYSSGFFVAENNFGGYNCLVTGQLQPP